MPTVTIGDNTGGSANTYSGTIDTQIKDASSSSNFGGDASFEVHKYDVGNHGMGLIALTGLSNITGPVTVSAASLFLWVNSGSGADIVITAKRLLRNWVESEATWNNYAGGNAWTTAGGLSDGNDRSATISGTTTFTLPSGETGTYHELVGGAQFIADVEGFINGTFSNFGWHLERTDGADDTTFIQFASSEGPNANRPYLSVTFTSASTIDVESRFNGPTPRGPRTWTIGY